MSRVTIQPLFSSSMAVTYDNTIQKQVAQGVATILIISTLVMLAFIFIGGTLSDRFESVR